MLDKEKMLSLLGDTVDVTVVGDPTILQVTDIENDDAAKSNSKRIGIYGRKRKEDGELPSHKVTINPSQMMLLMMM